MDLSLVLPFFNEEKCAADVVEDLLDELCNTSEFNCELILVNNGSTDNTRAVLDKFNGEHVKVIHKDINEPFGGAVIDGLLEASGDYVGFTWGDGQVASSEIAGLFQRCLDENIHVIKGKRLNRWDGTRRMLLSKGYTFLCNKMLGLSSEDVNGCPVIFKREFVEHLDLKFRNWGINIEILSKLVKAGYNPVESGVSHIARKGGKSKINFFTVIQMFVYLFQVTIELDRWSKNNSGRGA